MKRKRPFRRKCCKRERKRMRSPGRWRSKGTFLLLSGHRPPEGWRWSSGSEKGTKAKKRDGKERGRRRDREARQCRRSRRQRSSTSVRPSLPSSPMRPPPWDQFPDSFYRLTSIRQTRRIPSLQFRGTRKFMSNHKGWQLMTHVRFCFWW